MGWVMLGLLAGSAVVLTARATENEVTQLVSQVKAVGAGQWVGWDENSPSALYYYREGEKPRLLGTLPDSPLSMAVGNGRVLWVGNNFYALAPLNRLDQVKVGSFAGQWDTVVANSLGFLMKDGPKLMYSPDGEKWQSVENGDSDENTSILGMAASPDKFALLQSMETGQEGSDYVYSMISVSTDGHNWTNGYFSEPNPGEPELTMIGYHHGRWVAAGVGSSYTSKDGNDWEPSPMSRQAVPQLRGGYLQTGGGEWWVINWRDEFEFSPDGLDWSAKPESLYGMKGAGPVWVVGPEGMRNLGLDGQGRVRALTLAALQAGPPQPERLDNQTLAKQWAQLDEQLQAEESMVGFSLKLGELSLLFSQAQDQVLGQAFRSSALVYVLQRGDLACLAAFKPALSDQAYRDATFMMEKTLGLKKQLAQQGKTVPPVARAERGDKVIASQLNPARMRLNFLSGVRGSAYDISLAFHSGNGVKPDRDLAAIWHLVTQKLIPGVDDYGSASGMKKLLEAGSGVMAGNGLGEINLTKGEAGITPEQWNLIAQAEAGGVIAAARLLEVRQAWLVDADHMPDPVWPPRGNAASQWDAAQTARMKSLFDRHVRFSRDVMAYRAALTPGEAPDQTKWQTLLARHQALWDDPEIGALHEAYVQNSVGIALMFSRDTPIDRSWGIHLQEAKRSLATVAISPDIWAFRARMLQWSGQLDEARRDAAIAVLLLDLDAVKADTFFELLEEKTRMLQLELSLPETVLAAPQLGVNPYNLSVVKQNAFLGKKGEGDEEMALKLYANFGARLRAAWQIEDPALRQRTEAALFKIHGLDLGDVNYPEAIFAERRKQVEAIWVSRMRDQQTALVDLEAVLTENPHPYFLSQRALLLRSLGRTSEALAGLENILLVWPGYQYAKKQLAALEKDVDEIENKQAVARYEGALAKLNHGDLAGGRAILDQMTAITKPPLEALLVLAEVQMDQRLAVETEATVRRAYQLYPNEGQAVAQMASFLIAQRKVSAARQILNRFSGRQSEDTNVQAVALMADVMDAMGSGSNAVPVVENALGKLQGLKSSGAYQPQVFGISAQLNMLLGNQREAVDDMARMAGMKSYVPPATWFRIGQLYRNLGMIEQAKFNLQKAADHGVEQARAILETM